MFFYLSSKIFEQKKKIIVIKNIEFLRVLNENKPINLAKELDPISLHQGEIYFYKN
ncbi:MAG: hypothetical protein ACI9LE_001350 [Paraglaciecola sp.]|jgi:hypothetical protein